MKKENQETKEVKRSKWLENAEYRIRNRWLIYSSEIARRILAAIDENKGFTQAKLAEKLQVSPQQISKIVKGKENLTLETIYKISQALGVELISFPGYEYSRQISSVLNTEPVREVVTTAVLIALHNTYNEHCDKLDVYVSSNTPESKAEVTTGNTHSLQSEVA